MPNLVSDYIIIRKNMLAQFFDSEAMAREALAQPGSNKTYANSMVFRAADIDELDRDDYACFCLIGRGGVLLCASDSFDFKVAYNEYKYEITGLYRSIEE